MRCREGRSGVPARPDPPAPWSHGPARSSICVDHSQGGATAPSSTLFLVDADSTVAPAGRDAIASRLEAGRFFWLDIHGPDAEGLSLLRDVFRFHPIALEDSEHFGQRPKLDTYDDYVMLVVYGAAHDEDDLVEVHCFLSEKYLVTVHHDDCPAFSDLRTRITTHHLHTDNAAFILYAVVDALVDSFFPLLSEFDDRIDTIEDRVFQAPDDAQLQEVFAIKRKLVDLRKVITPERDLFARVATGVFTVPGMTSEAERYYRDVYDHLIRISDLIDSYRDLTTGAMDVYLSTVSNRLNDVMKRLTIVATIFMPLTWLTGFFGMNFGRLVLNITGWTAFLTFGLATQVLAVVIMLLLFRKQGWI
jgi:magnesium transporter